MVEILADGGESSIYLDNQNGDGFAWLISRFLFCRRLPCGADRDGTPPWFRVSAPDSGFRVRGAREYSHKILRHELNLHLEHSDPLM